MKTSVILRAARQRLTPSGAWVQGTGAKNAAGEALFFHNGVGYGGAVCWCAAAAIAQVVCEQGRRTDDSDFELLARVIEPENTKLHPIAIITRWNDAPGRTQAELLAGLDSAIKLAESGEAFARSTTVTEAR